MSITKNSVQGQKFSLQGESALGVPAGAVTDFRPESGIELPTATVNTYMPESGGRTNPADVNKVIPYKGGDGTGTIPMVVRRATTTLTPTVVRFLEAAGFKMAKLTGATTIAAGTVVDSIVFAGDVGQEDASAVLVEVTPDVWEPVRLASWEVGTLTGVPLFKMSADPADGNAVEQMFTLYPQSGPLPTDKTLRITELSRATDSGSDPQEFIHRGLAMNLNAISITPNEPLKFEFGVLIADTDLADGVWSAEVDNEMDGVCLCNNDFRLLMETSNAAGAITRTSVGIRSVNIEPGVEVVKVTSVGDDDDVNSVGGYAVKLGPPKITIEGWFDADKWDDYETEFVGGAGTNPDKALALSFTSQDQALYPSVLVTMPKCNLSEAPTAKLRDTDSNLVEGSLVYTGTAAGLNGGDGPTAAADQAIYIDISGTA